MSTITKKKKVVQMDPADLVQDLLKKYPTKVARKRAKQIMIKEAEGASTPEMGANC